MKKAVLFGLLLMTACWVFGQVESTPTLYYGLVNGFNSPKIDWKIMENATSFAVYSSSTEHVTEGTASLKAKLTFDENLYFIGLYQDFPNPKNFKNIKSLVFDIFNASEDNLDIAVAIQGGDKWTWFESIPKNLAIGANTIRFDLTKPNYKTEANGGTYSSGIEDLDQCRRVTLMIFAKDNNEGVIYLDNFRVESDQPIVEEKKPEKAPEKPATPAKTTTKVKPKTKK